MVEKTLVVNGMSCGSCVKHVEGALKELPGVIEAKVDLPGKKVTVKFEEGKVTLKEIADAIEEAGYEPQL